MSRLLSLYSASLLPELSDRLVERQQGIVSASVTDLKNIIWTVDLAMWSEMDHDSCKQLRKLGYLFFSFVPSSPGTTTVRSLYSCEQLKYRGPLLAPRLGGRGLCTY